MQKIFTEVKTLEEYACSKFSLTEDLMIENAAVSLEKVIRAVHASARQATTPRGFAHVKKICILCGSGNNGADGYALARRLAGEFEVAIVATEKPKSPECKKLSAAASAAGVKIVSHHDVIFSGKDERYSVNFNRSESAIQDADVIVDCIYGTGFHGTLDSETARLISRVNKLSAYKIACDIPSGIDKNGKIATTAKTGEKISPLAFCADITVTMGGYKLALFSDAAKCFTGKIVRGQIGVAERKLTENFTTPFMLVERADMKLPLRTGSENKAAHKGSYGHAVFFMGEKFGAATIAATAALNFGAGLVSVIDVCQDEKKLAPALSPELMYTDAIPENATALCIGPGLGRGRDVANALNKTLHEWLRQAQLSNPSQQAQLQKSQVAKSQMKNSRAVVFDADIFYQENFPDLLREALKSNMRVVLTPHPKEFQQILHTCSCELLNAAGAKTEAASTSSCDLSLAEIIANRFELARELSKKFGSASGVLCSDYAHGTNHYENSASDTHGENGTCCATYASGGVVLVLKGAYTLIAQNGEVRVCGEGTAALAKGGSGDVLCGMICALLAQGYDALEAATTAVLAHGIAAQKFDAGERHCKLDGGSEGDITSEGEAYSSASGMRCICASNYALTPLKLIDAVATLA